jgi:hypothetical protein
VGSIECYYLHLGACAPGFMLSSASRTSNKQKEIARGGDLFEKTTKD